MDKKQIIHQIIRVNQSGEYGAKRIYQGQLDFIKNSKYKKEIKHMADQEEAHLEYFNSQIQERNIRPSILMPLWNIAGYALGAVTALMGEKAAMACTVAIESVINEHYNEQQDLLKDNNSEISLRDNIEKFRLEELEHHDKAIEFGAEEILAYNMLANFIKTGSKAAIWLAKRF